MLLQPRRHTPSDLPSVDAVQVLSLREVRPSRVDGYLVAAGSAPTVDLGPAEAQTVAGLWRALPAGEQARCHLPPFGVRFFSAGDLVLEASICWKCNNVFGADAAGGFHFEFDAAAAPSRRLLALLQGFPF